VSEIDTNTLTNLLVAAIGFLGGVVAVIITSRLTAQDERKKRQIEKYQKVFTPIYLDVLAFIDVFANSYNPDLEKQQQRLDKITKHIEANLADVPALSSNYYAFMQEEERGYFGSVFPKPGQLRLLLTFLDEMYYATKRLPTGRRDKHDLKAILKYRILYLYWLRYFRVAEITSTFLLLGPVVSNLKVDVKAYNSLKRERDSAFAFVQIDELIKRMASVVDSPGMRKTIERHMAYGILTGNDDAIKAHFVTRYQAEDDDVPESNGKWMYPEIKELRPDLDDKTAWRYAAIIEVQEGRLVPRFGFEGVIDTGLIAMFVRVCEMAEADDLT
jgi:hypothetical protein